MFYLTNPTFMDDLSESEEIAVMGYVLISQM